MPLIHRIIPEQHIATLTGGILYFSPCDKFVDQLEFRFAYCRDAFEVGGDEQLANCVRSSFSDEEVTRKITETSISCWTSHPDERAFMWEVYGGFSPAVLVSADESVLLDHVTRHKGPERTASGPVTYHFLTSFVRPQFLTPPSDPSLNADYDLFFHKHGFYSYEKEYRIVIFERGPIEVPLPPEIIQRVTLSPFGQISSANRGMLEQVFGNRLFSSSLNLPY